MSYIAERRLEEKERRRAEIVDAAEAVATEVGIDAMTMDEVARKARLSRALLYVYFQDKTDLVCAVCERGLEELHRRFVDEAARHPRGLSKVEGLGRAYVAFSRERPVYFEALARLETRPLDATEPDSHEGACIALGDRVHEFMVECIDAGIRDGSIRRDIGTPKLVSFTLWGFMHGIIQLATTKANVMTHHGFGGSELVDQALRMCTRSLQGPAIPAAAEK